MRKHSVKLSKLGAALNDLVKDLGNDSVKGVAQQLEREKLDFERAAKQHYHTVLNERSGRLFKSIKGVLKRTSNRVAVGLKDAMKYAKYLEYGTKHITARYFLTDPLMEVAQGIVERLKAHIGWK